MAVRGKLEDDPAGRLAEYALPGGHFDALLREYPLFFTQLVTEAAVLHIWNKAREDFRQKSYFADIALGVISGFRGDSYLLALQAIINRIEPPVGA